MMYLDSQKKVDPLVLSEIFYPPNLLTSLANISKGVSAEIIVPRYLLLPKRPCPIPVAFQVSFNIY